ncbi:MAG: hypothetical protein WCF84_08770 [Anaerolineae bacterium]
MSDWGPSLPETRVVPFGRIRRERRLPVRGEVSAATGGRLDPLDVIARAIPPRGRRALSLTRVLGVREADVPRRLLKQVGDTVEAREIIISKPINFGLQQLVYRAPGAGTIVAIKGSWMVIDLDGMPVDLKALYRGTVVSVMPRVGAIVEAQGALVQGVWGSGQEGYGVIRMVTKSTTEVLEADPLSVDNRGTILIAGAGITEEALRKAESLHAAALVVGSLEGHLRAVAQKLEMPVIITEGFGHIPMASPIFELFSSLNGQEAAVNGAMQMRGGARRPEVFIPIMGGRNADRGIARDLVPLTVKPGARVRVLCEPYLGRVGVLPKELLIKWSAEESGVRMPSVEVELQDAQGMEQVIIPWTNLELIG